MYRELTITMEKQFLILISMIFCLPSAGAQSTANLAREVGDKCLAAFVLNPPLSAALPPRAFCLCVAQQVSSSEDDRKSAIDKAGNFCLQLMSSPKIYGVGLAKGRNESCLKDPEILAYYPKTYREFCSCLGGAFADEITSNRPLTRSLSNALAAVIGESTERAMQKCVNIDLH